MENIVKAMDLDCGFLVYPNGQRLQIVDDKGNLVYDYKALLTVLKLLDMTSQKGTKIFLPAWAPDFCEYENLEITRGKLSSVKAQELKEYTLIASTDGHFAFNEFGLNSDSVYASFKILELIQKANIKISTVVKNLPNFIFKGENVACPSQYKGKMMRKFLEDGKGKDTSNIDGIKTWLNEDEWILMVPDEHSDYLNLYIQAENEKSAQKIFWDYQSKIEKWIKE
ncbi:MAG: mannose-1-phosphate guanyltransferase, partial [Campylobacterota bacterium]|nr:mannose-1-phosphate guanyltransferase [Campylobacterota bacterium]